MSHILVIKGKMYRHMITGTPGTCDGCDYSDMPCKIGEAPCTPDTVLRLCLEEPLKLDSSVQLSLAMMHAGNIAAHSPCDGCFGASWDTRFQCAGCVDGSKREPADSEESNGGAT